MKNHKNYQDASEIMKPVVLYYSKTGKTRLMAEAIASALNAPAMDLTAADIAAVGSYDLLVLGTPVNGARPAAEAMPYIATIPQCPGKKSVVFCTYAMFKGSTLKVLERELSKKGFQTVLSVAKKGVKQGETDFSDVQRQVSEAASKV